MNRKLPLWLVLLILWFVLMGTIWFGWRVWVIKSSRQGEKTRTDHAIIAIASFPNMVRESFKELHQKSTLIMPDLYPGINGLKTENKYVDSGYLLLTTFDMQKVQSVAKLLRLSDGKVVYQWTPDYDQILKLHGDKNKDWPEKNKRNLRLYSPLLLQDGSLIFNNVLSPLIKIDKDSKLVWAIDGQYHHSVELDADGNIWAPSVIKPSAFFKNVLDNLKDDAITEISPEGRVLFRKSVAEILVENGYQALLLGVGPYEKDLLHLNDIQPALTSGRYWMKGDLLVSVRNRSTIFLYRPATGKILWLKTGPWLTEHDVNFIDSARISIFGNNMVRIFGDERLLDGYNQEYIFNFKTGKIDTPYTAFLRSARVSTPTEGRAEILPDGNLFIEETNKNRLLMGNTKCVLWQFTDRIAHGKMASLSWSRYITAAEFKKLTFLTDKKR